MPIINQVVKGGGSGPTGLYREFELDNTGKLIPSTTTTHIMDFTGMTDVDTNALYRAYHNNTAISGAVDMSDLTRISGDMACYYMFFGCTGITSVDLSSLTTISGQSACQYMFRNNTSLSNVSIGLLKYITARFGCQYMFAETNITSIDLHSLESITPQGGVDSMFYGCASLVNVNLNSLQTITGSAACKYMFANCVSLTSLSFPAIKTTSFGSLTNQFQYMCQGIPNITLHFPSNVQSVIEGLTGYSATAPFSAISGTVLFDLPATE